MCPIILQKAFIREGQNSQVLDILLLTIINNNVPLLRMSLTSHLVSHWPRLINSLCVSFWVHTCTWGFEPLPPNGYLGDQLAVCRLLGSKLPRTARFNSLKASGSSEVFPLERPSFLSDSCFCVSRFYL